MTLRKIISKLIYRLYLHSPGWHKTRELRKRKECKKCKSKKWLQLHHLGYGWHNTHKITRWFVPNTFDPMQTLCRNCHGKEHKR